MKKEHQLKDIPIVELLKIQYLTYEQRGNKWAKVTNFYLLPLYYTYITVFTFDKN